MTYQNVLYEVKGRIATITLNRPDKLNALNEPLLSELESALKQADIDDSIHAIILKGAGRAFSAGFDVAPSEARSGTLRNIAIDRNRLQKNMDRLFLLWSIRKPVIAQVHGYCTTGGTIIALLCDITVVAEDARIAPAPLAGPLGAGLTSVLWAWHIGPKKAKELCFRIGVFIDGQEAARIGWANRAVPADRLDEEVWKLAEEIAETPLELLTLEKLTITRMQESMGLRAAAMFGVEIDAIAHFTEPVQRFNQLVRERGLKQASTDWRREL